MIPALHVVDLRDVLRRHQPTVRINERPLINFSRSIEIMHWIRKLHEYKLPSLTRTHADVAGPLAYLESQLAAISVAREFEEYLEKRSDAFAVVETSLFLKRSPEFRSVGLRI